MLNVKQKCVEDESYSSNQALKAIAGKACQQKAGIFWQDSYAGSTIWSSGNQVMHPGKYRLMFISQLTETSSGNEPISDC